MWDAFGFEFVNYYLIPGLVLGCIYALGAIGITLTLFPSGRRVGTDAVVVSGNNAPEVARGDEPTYHARFVRMSDADRQAVEEHVKNLLGKRVSFED